jgi:hypothetical protein
VPRRLLVCVALASACHGGSGGADAGVDGVVLRKPFFHGDRARSGWNPNERFLTPAHVHAGGFGRRWRSEPLDALDLDGRSYPPHLYASPLYVDGLAITSGADAGRAVDVILAATSNGWVYAVAAHDRPGHIVWRARLTQAAVASLDGGMPMGILSTPALDLDATPPRLYAASMDRDAGWQVFALDLGSGSVLDGWPVTLTQAALDPVNRNGPARLSPATATSQRAALNLSPDGGRLYVGLGGYGDGATGWTIAVDTRAPRLAAAFSLAPILTDTASGGVWGAGGPAVDALGQVWVTTGNAPAGLGPTPGVWGSSLVRWDAELRLTATYSPWNYCQLEQSDSDLGGGSPIVLPDLDPAATATPHLLAHGGKQGNVYLHDRDHLPGGTAARPPCSEDPASEGSLLPPGPQAHLGVRGPLNVFGPYSEGYNNFDYAKMRSTPALYRDATGALHLFVSGSSKAAPDSATSVPPSLVRLGVVTAPGQPAYLAVERQDARTAMWNPGSPVVSSDGALGAVVWVLDANGSRLASLVDANAPHPILYAFDGDSLELLWGSADGELAVGGKYATVAVAHGEVYVGTDRIEAFALAP